MAKWEGLSFKFANAGWLRKAGEKKYSDLSGSSVICCCEPAKVVGSDSEQEIEEYLIKPLTLIIEIIEQNQSFYVY